LGRERRKHKKKGKKIFSLFFLSFFALTRTHKLEKNTTPNIKIKEENTAASSKRKISKSKKKLCDRNQSTNNTHSSQHCNKSAINDAMVALLVGW